MDDDCSSEDYIKENKSQVWQGKPLVTVAQVAEYLQVDVSFIYRLVYLKELPVTKIRPGRSAMRFNPEDVEEFLKCRKKMTAREISQ